MKNTYLTIDLNFWRHREVDVTWLGQMLDSVAEQDRVAAIHHHSILPHTRRYAAICTKLINLDCHSDLAGCMEVSYEDGYSVFRRLELHSRSWGDYVEFARKLEFVWGFPWLKCPVACRCDDYSDDGETPFACVPQAAGKPRKPWRKLRCYFANCPGYGIELAEIRAVSIVLSPNCCGPFAIDAFRSLVSRYRMEVLDCLPEDLKAMRLVPAAESNPVS